MTIEVRSSMASTSIKNLNRKNVVVEFLWIPSHTGNNNFYATGNEIADKLASEPRAVKCWALKMANICKKEMKNLLLLEERKKASKFPANTHKISKKFRLDERVKRGEDLCEFDRKEFNLLLKFTTGFSCLAHHVKYIKKDLNMGIHCRFCNSTTEETSVHVIESCEFFTARRLKIFGKNSIEFDSDKPSMRDILRFISSDILKLRLTRWFDSIAEAKKCLQETNTKTGTQ